jgi:hypothetical protein
VEGKNGGHGGSTDWQAVADDDDDNGHPQVRRMEDVTSTNSAQSLIELPGICRTGRKRQNNTSGISWMLAACEVLICT